MLPLPIDFIHLQMYSILAVKIKKRLIILDPIHCNAFALLLGPWLLHCHNELHVEQGMIMVIEVGEPKSWPQNPEPSYKCGAYELPPKDSNTQILKFSSTSSLHSSPSSVFAMLFVPFISINIF